MEKAEYVNMPRRQMRAQQQIQDEDEAIETAVKMFSLENAADRVFHRKKKMVGELDDEEVDGDRQNDNRNQLAVLPSDFDDDFECTGEEMEDWLRKLHIRTQHLVGKVTLTGMSRLAATNHVATALTRFKGKYRIDTGKDESNEDNSLTGTDQSLPVTTPPIQTPKVIDKENPSKEEAVRSKKIVKQSTEHRVQKRKENSSSKVVVVSSHIRKATRASIPAASAISTDGIRKTTNVKITKNLRSIPSKSKIQ
ncbi:uncharacterized protein LOC130695396 [Daphnia carinata]|uniref:uncharacterized protein LOC130695396 n=1 Tax=Daphnia carinata TaxID=120202 RepID=UPI00257B2C63|nr:uncharacterized protein LOC130695396 [Daphnia carinata]